MSSPRPQPTPRRIVLDTNLVLSALVFGGGMGAVLRDGWHSQRFIPLASRETTSEIIRVLTYPKFGLTQR